MCSLQGGGVRVVREWRTGRTRLSSHYASEVVRALDSVVEHFVSLRRYGLHG